VPVLTTEAGVPVPVPDEADARDKANQAFTAAMAASGEDKAPPVKQERSPAEDRPTPARRRRGRPPKDEQARTAPKAAVIALDDAQRAEGVKGLAQLGAGLCLMASKATGNDAFRADAIVIASNTEQIADACVQTARANPGFASALDKVCAAGPYAALVGVMVGIGSQIARNHRPGLHLPNTMDPAEILRQADRADQAEPEQLPDAA
jgi:hypothetical protein